MVLTCKKTLATLHILDIPPTDNVWPLNGDSNKKIIFFNHIPGPKRIEGDVMSLMVTLCCDIPQQIPVDGLH